MCGDKAVLYELAFTDLGSPPHVRGQDFLLKLYFAVDRITPACAGTRTCQPTEDSAHKDHPRMCGDKALTYSLSCF